jgi:CheY-like chemotaxis protein
MSSNNFALTHKPSYDIFRLLARFSICLDMDVQSINAREGVMVDSRRSVLIVDRSQENREVLQTVLERRGLRIFTADAAQEGLALAHRHRPDMIVLDLELDDSGPEALCAPFAEQSRINHGQLVMLGSLRASRRLSDGEFVSKPYDYGPLIRKIEELLEKFSSCHHCS